VTRMYKVFWSEDGGSAKLLVHPFPKATDGIRLGWCINERLAIRAQHREVADGLRYWESRPPTKHTPEGVAYGRRRLEAINHLTMPEARP
jgi:hypothetical protein